METQTVSDEEYPLRALIRRAHERGRSYRAMVDRAERMAENPLQRISHGQIEALQKGRVRNIPRRDAIAALAHALDMPVETVMAAVVTEFLGWSPNSTEDGRVTIALPKGTSAEAAADAHALVEAYLSRKSANA